jgi:hypothetical protein
MPLNNEQGRLKERVQDLENDIRNDRHYVYEDLPFAIFCYEPQLEWPMRQHMRLLQTRLENSRFRRVRLISLADLLWQAVRESEGLETVLYKEAAEGFEAAQHLVFRYLTMPIWRPLAGLLAAQLRTLDAASEMAFVWRTGALAPNLYRVSKLTDELKLQNIRVSCILWMPAVSHGDTVLRFMGLDLDEGRGSYHTKVYTD